MVGGQRHAPAALPLKENRYRFLQEAGWAPGPVWAGVDSIIGTPLHRLARNETLYATALCRPTFGDAPFLNFGQVTIYSFCHSRINNL
jgi:hypothetical protein